MMTEYAHQPVLLKEVFDYLAVKEGEKYIDATIGLGGHTAEILARGGKVLGIDVDSEALEAVRERFPKEVKSCQLMLACGNFAEIEYLARERSFTQVAGILYDLGVSSLQLDKPARGFSWRFPGQPLDMRMDSGLAVRAGDLVNGLSEAELTELFTRLGEERLAKVIARKIVAQRKEKPLRTVDELAEIVVSAYPSASRFGRIHPATRVFQALRLAVNAELENLTISLPRAVRLLKPGGRILVISFHSLEDRIVKRFGERPSFEVLIKTLTKKPIEASKEEVVANHRSRSAKLRVFEL
ncbi:MAG: 16S rRNA (cytosine(1402)-N(4))-methyltransferase RsmH [bacterium]|nr:16S rRNA (cytosine(1402)-N(4))-methyltransferase RsmH [bacterium]